MKSAACSASCGLRCRALSFGPLLKTDSPHNLQPATTQKVAQQVARHNMLLNMTAAVFPVTNPGAKRFFGVHPNETCVQSTALAFNKVCCHARRPVSAAIHEPVLILSA